MLKGRVILNEQEDQGYYMSFTKKHMYMTAAYFNTFGDEAGMIASTSIALVLKQYPDNADYLQTFQYVCPDGNIIRYWIIAEEDHITVLLPSDY